MPTFNGPALQRALQVVGPHIEGYTANLDAISHDIKTLEAYLNEHGCRVVVAVELSQGFVTNSEPVEDPGGYSGPVHQDVEYILLAKVANCGDRWRVCYRRVRYRSANNPWDREPHWEVADLIEFRPLIETSVQVRLRAYQELPTFFKEVGMHYSVDPEGLERQFSMPFSGLLDDSEIPF